MDDGTTSVTLPTPKGSGLQPSERFCDKCFQHYRTTESPSPRGQKHTNFLNVPWKSGLSSFVMFNRGGKIVR